MRTEHDRAARWDLRELVDEDRALALEVLDNGPVVHDFVAHIDRRAELRQCLLDDRDRAIDACAKTTRIGEQQVHQSVLTCEGCRRCHRLSTISSPAPTVIALSATLNAGKGSSQAMAALRIGRKS